MLIAAPPPHYKNSLHFCCRQEEYDFTLVWGACCIHGSQWEENHSPFSKFYREGLIRFLSMTVIYHNGGDDFIKLNSYLWINSDIECYCFVKRQEVQLLQRTSHKRCLSLYCACKEL